MAFLRCPKTVNELGDCSRTLVHQFAIGDRCHPDSGDGAAHVAVGWAANTAYSDGTSGCPGGGASDDTNALIGHCVGDGRTPQPDPYWF